MFWEATQKRGVCVCVCIDRAAGRQTWEEGHLCCADVLLDLREDVGGIWVIIYYERRYLFKKKIFRENYANVCLYSHKSEI